MTGSIPSVYEFLTPSDLDLLTKKLRAYTDDQLVSAINRMGGGGKPSSKPYPAGRDTYCAVNLILNERGLIAPFFRPFRAPRNAIGLPDDEVLLSRDRQVIDLHYLYCQHRSSIRAKDSEFKPLFKSPSFDFELASTYALNNWTAERKAWSLGLPSTIQMVLWAIRSKAVRDRHFRIRKARDAMEVALQERAAHPRSRLDYDAIPLRLIQFECLKLASGSPSGAVVFQHLMTGRRVEQSQMRAANEAMRKQKIWFKPMMGVSPW